MAWSMGAHRLGATVVVMERFDPVQALTLIERHRVTHTQFVPTMFVRLLKLPEADRNGFDLSMHRRDVTDALWAATLAANKGPGQWYADSDSLRYSFFDKVEAED